MKRVFETAECEEVRNSIFWEPRYKSTRTKWKVVAWLHVCLKIKA